VKRKKLPVSLSSERASRTTLLPFLAFSHSATGQPKDEPAHWKKIDGILAKVLVKGKIGGFGINDSSPDSVFHDGQATLNLTALGGVFQASKFPLERFTSFRKSPTEKPIQLLLPLIVDAKKKVPAFSTVTFGVSSAKEIRKSIVEILGEPKKKEAGKKVEWLTYEAVSFCVSGKENEGDVVIAVRIYCEPFIKQHSDVKEPKKANGK
jgi:hypothetical protein